MSIWKIQPGWSTAALILGWLCSGSAMADLVKLKTGGELRGKVVSDEQRAPREVSVRTVSGAMVTIRREDVEFIARRSLTYEEYELKARLAADTVAAQWELAEWCVSQRLMQVRERHLERIVELDPENEAAHKALGHQLRGGKWTTHEDYMLSRGYVRYRGRYITPEEKLLLESSQADREKQLAWFEKIRVWSNWLSGRYETQRQLAIEQLKTVDDPHAVPALRNFLEEHAAREVRIVYINTLSQIPFPDATVALAHLAVFDADQGIRLRAVNTIPEQATGMAAGEFIGYLRHADNLVVRRAGSALKQLGDQQAVPYLIEALVTNHKYRVAVEHPAVGVTLGPGGMVTPGVQPPLLPPDLQAALLTGYLSPESIHPPPNPAGAKQWVTVRVDQQNPEVLEALREITQADFGFDKRTWKLWWMAQNS
ncbi:MAG: HEAT repeat domain-containing protein [Planctomycetaceae bacterium]|nr:HEAT repeat domain-containing protein [Planctomycetaceae bacterium]